MIRDIRYIIKKVIIGIAIIIGVLFFKTKLGFAATIDTVRIDGSSNDLTSYWYKPANNSTLFDFIGVGSETVEDNIYFNMLLCTDAETGVAWAQADWPNTYSQTRSNFMVNVTNVRCPMKNASWQGHVVQIQTVTRTGADGGGDIRLYFRLSFNQESSISVTNYSFTANQYDMISSKRIISN